MRAFGWRRVQFSIPEGWRLIADSGRWDNAYFILGDEFENPRLEVTWRKMKLPKGGLKKLLDVYLKNLAKQIAKEMGRDVAKRLRVGEVEESTVAGHYTLRCKLALMEGESSLSLWHCNETGRVILTQINYREPEREKYLQLESDILASFKCHPGPRVLWTVGPFDFYMPYKYALIEGSLNPLFSYLQYSTSRETRYLIVAWTEMAPRVLPSYDGSLKRWLEDTVVRNILRGLRGFRLKFEERSGEECPTVILRGHSIVVLPYVMKRVYGIAWLRGEEIRSLTILSHAEQFDEALTDLRFIERQIKS